MAIKDASKFFSTEVSLEEMLPYFTGEMLADLKQYLGGMKNDANQFCFYNNHNDSIKLIEKERHSIDLMRLGFHSAMKDYLLANAGSEFNEFNSVFLTRRPNSFTGMGIGLTDMIDEHNYILSLMNRMIADPTVKQEIGYHLLKV